MCGSEQHNFVICADIARESYICIIFPLVYILIRYIDAFVKRIALAQIFEGQTSGGALLSIHFASRL